MKSKKEQVVELVRNCMVENRNYSSKELKAYVEKELNEVLSSGYFNVTLTRECDKSNDIEKIDRGYFRRVVGYMGKNFSHDSDQKYELDNKEKSTNDIDLNTFIEQFIVLKKRYRDRYSSFNVWDSSEEITATIAETIAEIESIKNGLNVIENGIEILKKI